MQTVLSVFAEDKAPSRRPNRLILIAITILWASGAHLAMSQAVDKKKYDIIADLSEQFLAVDFDPDEDRKTFEFSDESIEFTFDIKTSFSGSTGQYIIIAPSSDVFLFIDGAFQGQVLQDKGYSYLIAKEDTLLALKGEQAFSVEAYLANKLTAIDDSTAGSEIGDIVFKTTSDFSAFRYTGIISVLLVSVSFYFFVQRYQFSFFWLFTLGSIYDNKNIRNPIPYLVVATMVQVSMVFSLLRLLSDSWSWWIVFVCSIFFISKLLIMWTFRVLYRAQVFIHHLGSYFGLAFGCSLLAILGIGGGVFSGMGSEGVLTWMSPSVIILLFLITPFYTSLKVLSVLDGKLYIKIFYLCFTELLPTLAFYKAVT